MPFLPPRNPTQDEGTRQHVVPTVSEGFLERNDGEVEVVGEEVKAEEDGGEVGGEEDVEEVGERVVVVGG